MHCNFFGSGEQTIVYLHGWGTNGECFLPTVRFLPHFYNVMPDFNGFGRSPMPPTSGWTVADYAEAVRMLFLQYNIQHATIVAHSFGCRVATVLAATYPHLCDKMLFFAPAALRSPSIKRWFRVAHYKAAKALRRFVGDSAPTGHGSADYNACPPELRNTFVKVVNGNLTSYIRRVPCRVLVVNGREDTETTLRHAERLTRMLPHASLQAIDGDHFALFYSPTAFARLITTFVREG